MNIAMELVVTIPAQPIGTVMRIVQVKLTVTTVTLTMSLKRTMPRDDSDQLRKDRFFYRKSCAYCGTSDKLQLDSIKPFTWVDESVWTLPEWEFQKLFVTEIQILCDSCLRRKKQTWKKYKKEGGKWLSAYISIDQTII